MEELQEAHAEALQALKDNVVQSIERFSTGELSPEGLLGELRELGIDAAVTLPCLTAAGETDEATAVQEPSPDPAGLHAPLPSAR